MSLYEAAEKAVKQSFKIKKGEKCVLVTDKENEPIANAIVKFMKEVGAEVNVYYLIENARPYTEVPSVLEKMFENSDFMLYAIKHMSGEKAFRGKMVSLGRRFGRICMMPGINLEMFERLANCDYDELTEFTDKVGDYIKDGEIIVRNDKGTDISFSLKGRELDPDVGFISEKGKFGNLPAGEVFTAPVEETFTGKVVFDLLAGYGGAGVFEFEKGKLVKWEGENVDKMIEDFKEDESAFIVGEFGVGTNKNATIVPSFLEAEKAFHTIHFAIGDSYDLGENSSKFHYDFLVSNPDVIVNGKYLMRKGEFIFE